MKYKVTYERTMEIEAGSEEEAIHKAIVEVSENCADSIDYSVKCLEKKRKSSKRPRPILLPPTEAEVDKIEKFLTDNGYTSVQRDNGRISGWLEAFEVEVVLDTLDFRFWCHTNGELPNCPERSTGIHDKGTDSLNFLLKFIKARTDEWNEKQKVKLK